jgi:hypothetical protein
MMWIMMNTMQYAAHFSRQQVLGALCALALLVGVVIIAPGPVRADCADPTLAQGVTQDCLDALNPLKTDGDPLLADKLSTPGGIISQGLSFAFPFAGMALFGIIIWGGFEILAGARDDKSIQTGKNRIVAGVIGFLMLFSTFWVIQLMQAVFGFKIL